MSQIPESPLVSIVCLTFNQQHCLAQTIDSFLAQKCRFAYEILIHDDASSDTTVSIARDYEAKYPDIIRVIAQPENLYSKGVDLLALTLGLVRGEFIAYCDGDDYWCSTEKLQMQADYLMAHPRCGVVFTRSKLYYEQTGRLVLGKDRSSFNRLSQSDAKAYLLQDNPFTVCTSMARASALLGYDQVSRQLRPFAADLVAWLHIAERYEIRYLPEVTAVYRVAQVSVSKFTRVADYVRYRRRVYKTMIYFGPRFGWVIPKNRMKDMYRDAMLDFCLSQREFVKSLRYYRSPRQYVSTLLKVLIRPVYRRLANFVYGLRQTA